MVGRKRQVADQEILRAVALACDPIVTAPELAEDLSMSRQGINQRLSDLVERELLQKRTVGSRAAVYWLTPDGRAELD